MVLFPETVTFGPNYWIYMLYLKKEAEFHLLVEIEPKMVVVL